jgi:MFS family permease
MGLPMTAPHLAERSDTLVIGLVALAHLLSHFYQVILGPLFPLLKEEFGVSYTALGLIISVFYGVSGLCQAFVGILVDRYGGDRLMLFGIVTMSSAVLLMGFVPAYWVFIPLAVLAALGNCVFHPADLSILSAKVHPSRLGRAFGLHGFGGTCGYFLAPVIVYYGIASIAGWRAGLVVAGLLGLGVALIIYRFRAALEMPRTTAKAVRESGQSADAAFYKGLLTNKPLVAAFFYFALAAGALAGLQSFSVTALVKIYNAPLYLAAAGITAYLGGSAVGILIGGELADRFRYPATIASGSLALAAVLMACIGWFDLSMVTIIALFCGVGFCSGVSQPSRDILVKGAAPSGASGKTFGFVYSGLDFGGAIGPIIFGWMMDGGEYRWVFLATAVMYGLAVLTVLQLRKGSSA